MMKTVMETMVKAVMKTVMETIVTATMTALSSCIIKLFLNANRHHRVRFETGNI
ncbi:MAG: hypothetical protein LKI15_07640 [Aneurinibacillus aneurinilyticus]|nr:hypothetical protein [Aneurinibacillus aneurinilyticus]MCI1693690.1 hypothetical protein [Aneurinibacillus aneurinilyticus]